MPKALIGRDQEVVSVLFGSIQQGAVSKLGLSALVGGIHAVALKVPPQGHWSALIEQDLH